MEHCERAWRAK